MATASDKNKKNKTSAKAKAGVKNKAEKKPATKKTAVKASAAPKKSAVKKPAAKKTAAKQKTAAKKTAPKKTVSRKATPKKAAPKKTVAKKTAAKKSVAKKATAKKDAALKKVVRPETAVLQEESSGNMQMLFFVGLAVFAVLSFMVFKSGRDGSTADNDRQLMLASHVVQYSVEARKKVAALQANGTPLSGINFDIEPEAGDETALFAKAGGDLEYTPPPVARGYTAQWRFLDVSDARDGFLVSGLGSDAAVRGRELVMYFEGLDPEICSRMRKGWGLDPEVPVQEVKLDFDHRAANAAGSNATTFYATPGREFSCFRNGRNGSYVYYHAIVVQ